MSPDLVRIEREDAVAVLTLDDPPVNALSNALLERLGDLVEELAGDEKTRAVVVTGAGEKAFAAGAKLPELAEIMSDRAAMEHHTGLTRRAFGGLAALPQPVIAAVQASAVGGGFELVLACDLAVVDTGAKVGVPEVGLGLIPGAGGTQRLTRRVGAARAGDLILSGRLVTATEAERYGAITSVAPSGRARHVALGAAGTLAAKPALAVRAAKRLIRVAGETSPADGLDRERDEFLELIASDDAREGVIAFIRRRAPSFSHS